MIEIMSCQIDENILSVVNIVKNGVMPVFQIGLPILLILLGCIDLGKIVISSDEKDMKESANRLKRRILLVICIFLLVTGVELITGWLVETGDSSVYNPQDCHWQDYWSAA